MKCQKIPLPVYYAVKIWEKRISNHTVVVRMIFGQIPSRQLLFGRIEFQRPEHQNVPSLHPEAQAFQQANRNFSEEKLISNSRFYSKTKTASQIIVKTFMKEETTRLEFLAGSFLRKRRMGGKNRETAGISKKNNGVTSVF